MAKTNQTFSVPPHMLEWACSRENVAFVDAKIRFPWIAEGKPVTQARLVKFAKAFHTPVGYLMLPSPPEESLPFQLDFRTVRSATPSGASVALLDTVRQCELVQDWYRDFWRGMTDPTPGVWGSAKLSENPASAARRFDAHTGFSRKAIQGAGSNRFETLRRVVEQLGGLVLKSGIVGSNTSRPLRVDEFRGFILYDQINPIIFVNGADAATANLFSLGHEIGHALLGQSAVGKCEPSGSGHRAELWANRFAAELLIDLSDADYSGRQPSLSEVKRLARIHQVSLQAVAIHLATVGAISDAHGRSLVREWEAEVAALPPPSKGGGDFYRTQRARLGNQLISAVGSAVLEGNCTYREGFQLLGVTKPEVLHRLYKTALMGLEA